ncbi:quinol dehydrogenase ferredoxin subunit NapH [Thalassotalea sp. G2M2-11]|uniref:quinol dehydrogenase ferredoxin subunit NapH n=1 Tax=Thalassotalea sp. G2M2-11 TaxID=2787627 RepID=UPI0019D0B749|nr:quinol dehydrogenase ferredoxin subunit NapH [Thalassotalea sp. G2M2-11]
MKNAVGYHSQQAHGFWFAHRLLILRRMSQVSILLLFLLGPWLNIWLIKGNLSSSIILDTVPLTDPFVFFQLLFSGHFPQLNAIIGVTIVLAFYWFIGGRVFCSWVCPVNMLTDLAAWLRRTLGINTHTKLSRHIKYSLLAACFIAPVLLSYVAWEMINPVSLMHRGIIFGIGYGWLVLTAIFLFDLFITRHGWCGHLCPMGAFYGLIGRTSQVKITASNRDNCNDCGDCYLICPEPHVLKPALKGATKNIPPIITNSDCSNCGRCIDVCEPKVFTFTMK